MSASIEEAIKSAARAAEAGDHAEAWRQLLAHKNEVTRAMELAWAWLVLYAKDPSPPDEADVLAELHDAWPSHPLFVELLARTYTAKVDGRVGDEPVPEDDPAVTAAALARRCLDAMDEKDLGDPEVGGALWMTYATALRLAGPRFDAEAERAFEKALATRPEHPAWLFNLGLFYKNRGRWTEALDTFTKVRALSGDEEPTLWNVAISATAVKDGDTAVSAWKALGLDARRGSDGLPVMDALGRVKVRLARSPGSAAGSEWEHVWARSLSPCHGVILNPTQSPRAADYGDVVLWDGAPIGWANEGGKQVPRFPMLAKLAPGGVRKFPFVARQPTAGMVSALNALLPDAVWIYVFDEQVRFVCQRCIETGGPHEASHDTEGPKLAPHRVTGALVVEPESDPAEAKSLFEPLLAASPDLTLAIPDLYAALGDEARAEEHWSVWARLEG